MELRTGARAFSSLMNPVSLRHGVWTICSVLGTSPALLVCPCTHIQEVVSHCKKLTKKNKEQLSDMMILDKQKGLKSLSREKRQKLEAYQHLFYLLQVSQELFPGGALGTWGGEGSTMVSVCWHTQH